MLSFGKLTTNILLPSARASLVHGLFSISPSQDEVTLHLSVVRVQLPRLLHLLNGLIILPCKIEPVSQVPIKGNRYWIEVEGLSEFCDRFLNPTHSVQSHAISIMGGRIAGIELKRSLKFLLATCPVPIVGRFDDSQ